MSEERRARRAKEKRAIRVARAAAKKQGCVCNVEVTITGHLDGWPVASVAHDDWCPLLRVMEERTTPPGQPQQAIIYDGGEDDG